MVFCNIDDDVYVNKVLSGHNPYFNRWFSAINSMHLLCRYWFESHNPYFNRWFSAIRIEIFEDVFLDMSQSLF